jgi:hypothetical protein
VRFLRETATYAAAPWPSRLRMGSGGCLRCDGNGAARFGAIDRHTSRRLAKPCFVSYTSDTGICSCFSYQGAPAGATKNRGRQRRFNRVRLPRGSPFAPNRPSQPRKTFERTRPPCGPRNLVLCQRLFFRGSLSNELDGKACETKETSHAGRKRSKRSWGGPGPFGPAKLELAAGAAGGICIPSNTDSLSRAILG